ncbi:hypothetical protein RFZ44_14680, partial [Acinetobacter sp. 163]|nr:hypothetical protein [Acinetobacter sp. 163]
MQEQKPSTSRFLDALENRHAQTQRQMADAISFCQLGSLIAFESGESVTYGLFSAQDRGTLF